MDAMLKMTGVKLEMFTDIEMYLFIDQSLRGGITTINHRYIVENTNFEPSFY